ncbi:DUF2938 family protein (plasmid) [Pseudoalteromonas espejiana]
MLCILNSKTPTNYVSSGDTTHDQRLYLYFYINRYRGHTSVDIYARLLAKFFTRHNWQLVRWVGHMKSGQFYQPALPKAEKIPGELAIGWVVHYLIGITYGLILMVCVNTQWLDLPTILPALLVAWFGIVAPFLL